jgi:hypothetical protein
MKMFVLTLKDSAKYGLKLFVERKYLHLHG